MQTDLKRRSTMQSKRILSALVCAMLLVAGTGIALAHGDEKHGPTTVQGEILDMACYVAHEATGPDHAACAKRCVKGGQPMGLLTEDGTVYLLYANHDDGAAFEATKDFAGQKVEVTGVEANRAGVKGLEVHTVKAL
jgi:hypothetical protein